jgi:hypothetical protein
MAAFSPVKNGDSWLVWQRCTEDGPVGEVAADGDPADVLAGADGACVVLTLGDRLAPTPGALALPQPPASTARHAVAPIAAVKRNVIMLCLRSWARRAGMPERSLAQRYVEEGLRHDAHPLIQFLDGPSGRRASLVGRGLDVWEVIATVRDNDGSIREAAEYLEVPAGLVEAAVAYYGEYRDEVDREIALNEAEYERGRAAAIAGEQALRS